VAGEVLADRLRDGFELVVGRGRRRELGPVTPGERTGVDSVLLRGETGECGKARDARFAAA
jgi:hypothetical protein